MASLTGISITAIVQSSSAVTVATIGFVNAGLINMYQALGVVYGANIGTTMTGWLVAIVGFKINVEIFALPMIGIGMLLRLTGGESRRAPLGLALAGFGLFFIGIDVLKEAFEGLAAAIDLQKFTLEGFTERVSLSGDWFSDDRTHPVIQCRHCHYPDGGHRWRIGFTRRCRHGDRCQCGYDIDCGSLP